MRLFLFVLIAFLSTLTADEVLAKYDGKELKYSQLKIMFEESLAQLPLEEGMEKRQLLLKQFTDSYLYHLALLDLAKADGFTLSDKSDDPKKQFVLEQSLLSKWTEKVLLPKVSVSYTEALLYFEENPKEFKESFDQVYPQLKDFLKRSKLKKQMRMRVMKKWQAWSVENLVP